MKRICLLACVFFACSGGEPLTPVDPPDASTAMDSTVPPPAKPSFTVTAPTNGQLFDQSTVEVRGTAMNLDAIDVSGTSVPVIEGAFTIQLELAEGRREIVVSAPEAGEQRIEVVVDLSAPILEIITPERGAFFDRSSTIIHVEGRARDAVTSIITVGVNGIPVVLDGDRFSIDLGAHEGVNLIEASAFDEAGHSADVLQGAIWGDYAPWGSLLPDAVSLGMRADVFDIFEAQLEQGLAAGLSTSAIAQQDPSFVVDSISFGDLDVQIVPETGYLDVAITIQSLAIDYTLNTVILGVPVQTTGVITADRVDMATEIHVGVGTTGELEAHTQNSTAAITGFAITAVNVAPWITNTLAAIIEPQLEMGFVQAVDAQDLSAIFDLSQLLPDGIDAQITAVTIDPSGMTMLADAAITSPPSPNAPPAPGVLITASTPPNDIPSTHQLRTSLSDDLINGALFNTWRSGALTASIAPEQVPGQIALDVATFALFFGDDLFDYAEPTDSVGLYLRPLLPPVAELSYAGAPTLELTAADAMIDFTVEPEGAEPIRFATFAVVLQTSSTVHVQNGAPSLETRTSVRIDLADAPLFPIEEELLEELITTLLFATELGNPLAGNAIPLDFGGLMNGELTVQDQYLSILADLQ